jgi:AraC-like DNA-binding protein
MVADQAVITSGNLATARRTVSGILGLLNLFAASDELARALITDAGLPPRALQEPDFPVSLAQDLTVTQAVVKMTAITRSPARALFEQRQHFGIEHLGVLGMAMRHAATAVDALNICLSYPQLTGGHSRLVVRRSEGLSLFSFSMERPVLRDVSDSDIDALVQHCLVMDLLSTLRNIEDIVETPEAPLYIHFAFAQPADWLELRGELPCVVIFDQEQTCLAYPGLIDDTPLPGANLLLFRTYTSIAEKLSLMLAEDVTLTERVSRWLWAYSPPLRRGEIARQLAISERTLTRQLQAEGSSYAHLLATVQGERARTFLRNRALTVAEIGYRLGYSEPAAFTRAFSKWTGLSPLKWRQQYQ